jgi:nucleotide-binding universal stress UspA family protein
METYETNRGDRGSNWIKRIVVAADGSPASRRGLEEVADLAPRIGAQVAVVHVRHLPTTAFMTANVPLQQVLAGLDEMESTVRQEATRLLGGTGVSWDFVVREGSPGEEIVRVIDEMDADLVVVGSNRHSSLHNLVLGSTAAHLAAHSPAPLLVMRSRVRRSLAPEATATTR